MPVKQPNTESLFFQSTYPEEDCKASGCEGRALACGSGDASYIGINATGKSRKVISVESSRGIPQFALHRVIRMVPDRDKGDKRLVRLLAFRLQHDGEAATCEYLMRYIRKYIRRPEPRAFYDFLVRAQSADAAATRNAEVDPDPPGAA